MTSKTMAARRPKPDRSTHGTAVKARGLRGSEALIIAGSWALVTGFVEVSVAAFRQRILHKLVWVGPDFTWMTPLAYLVLFLALACLLHLAASLARRRISTSACVATFSFCSAFSVLLPYGQVAHWASALLAAGFGIQMGRAARMAPERYVAGLRAIAGTLGAVMIAAGLTVRVARARSEREAHARLPAPSPGAPNVLLIVLDTVRSSSLGLYGYERPTTPELERWARDGVTFDRAIATAPWTLPSHGSLFTGRAAGSLTADWNRPISSGPRTLAEVFGGRGYETGGFVSNLTYASYESGLARGFVHYDDYQVSLPLTFLHAAPVRTGFAANIVAARSPGDVANAFVHFELNDGPAPSDMYRPADQVAQAFLEWQQQVSGRPFFAFINLFDAHGGYRSPEAFRARFARIPAGATDRYDASIAWLDHVVGGLLDSLQQRGLLEHTIVVITSDHGEQFGEHNLKGHANSLYLPVLHVPLVIRYPSTVPRGKRIDALVTLRDLPSTILDLAGISGEGALPGVSLTHYWRSMPLPASSDVVAEVNKGINVNPAFPNGQGSMVSRLDDELHYIRDGTGKEELYLYRIDPLELHNLAADPERRADLIRLRRGLGPHAANANTWRP